MDNENRINSRRNFLGGIAATAAGFTILPDNLFGTLKEKGSFDSVSLLPDNSLPVFNVCNFGAVGDGVLMNTAAIQSLIDDVSKKGGGVIFFPPGNFLTGTFQIKSNIEIYVSAGATVWGSKDRLDYKFGCMVYAEDAKNISITGMGTINGNGKSFWEKFLKQQINEEEMREKMWRPGDMMKFIRCENILLENITVENSPAWTIHPIDCERVTITGISLLNGVYEEDGPNTDGINPDGCSYVRISNCYLRCGDDCIVLKITESSVKKICRDIVITNCVLQTTETALKIGTETYGEFRNITFSNCVVHDSGGTFGLLMRDGGLIDGVSVSNITSDCTRIKKGQGIFIWSHRRTDKTPWGMIRNVSISDMVFKGGGGILINGVKEKHIEGLTLENIRIQVEDGRNTSFHEDPPYPFTVFGHGVAPYDIFCRYVDDLKLRNIELRWSSPELKEWGSAIRCWDVKELEISGFTGRQSLPSDKPAIWLKDVKGAYIYNCRAPEGTGTVLHIDNGTEKVTIMGNEYSRAKKIFTLAQGVDAKEIFESGNRIPSIK
jgi:polygalacturonase